MAEKYPTIPLNYQEDLNIDQHQLELEWLSIAKQIMTYSEAFAQAIYDRNRAKESLDATKADLDSGIRMAASTAGEKITEAVVSNRMQVKPTHIEALQNLHKADYVVDLLRGAVAAFQAKKSALENLVRLFGMKYYAEPYDPSGSNTKPIAMEQGKRAGVEALKSVMVNDPGIITKMPGPETNPNRERWAVGSTNDRPTFSHGPFLNLEEALECIPNYATAAIYKLVRNQPDELNYIWKDDQWTATETMPSKPPTLPPRPPMRPLPRKS